MMTGVCRYLGWIGVFALVGCATEAGVTGVDLARARKMLADAQIEFALNSLRGDLFSDSAYAAARAFHAAHLTREFTVLCRRRDRCLHGSGLDLGFAAQEWHSVDSMLDSVRSCLSDEDPGFRVFAIMFLGSTGNPDHLGALRNSLGDEDFGVRSFAKLAIEMIEESVEDRVRSRQR